MRNPGTVPAGRAPGAPLHPVLEDAFSALEAAGARWALSRDPLDFREPPGDVDVLVHRADRELAAAALEGRGFARVPRRGPDVHLARYHRPTDVWLWLHLADRIRLGPCGLLRPGCEGDLLARRRTSGTISRLAPGDTFWTLFLHYLLDRGEIPPRRREELEALAPSGGEPGPLGEVVAKVAPRQWPIERLLEAVRSGEWSALEAAGPSLSESWFHHDSLSGRRLRLCRVRRLLDRAFRPRARLGLTVAVLGPDGAGKSTLVEGLRQGFVFPVKRIYMGLTGGVLPRVERLRLPGLVQLGHLCVFWGRYLRGRYRKARGHLVVFERYVYDAVAPHPEPQGALRRGIRRLYGHSCPPPDVTFFLDAPGSVMHARSGEYTAETLAEWRKHFLTLRGRVPGFEVVNANRPPAQVRADVTERIWDRYRRRWRGAGT